MTQILKTKGFSLTAANLKWMAIITMFVNHFCSTLAGSLGIDNYFVNTANWYLTRIAFVIFAYQIAEGMYYTKNRRKYILSLLIFAVISELPYDLCFYGTPLDLKHQNVIFNYASSAIVIDLIEKLDKKPLYAFIICLVAMAINTYFNSDYAALGIVTVVSFYFFRKNKTRQLLITAILFIIFTLTFYLHIYAVSGQSVAETLASDRFWYVCGIELHGLCTWPLLMLYKGEKGKTINKWFFYLFYPGHLTLFYIISLLV